MPALPSPIKRPLSARRCLSFSSGAFAGSCSGDEVSTSGVGEGVSIFSSTFGVSTVSSSTGALTSSSFTIDL